MEQKALKFPAGFFWGAATSAHQVEGDNHNNWSVWEKDKAAALAQGAAKLYGWLPNWPEIKQQAQNPNNYISGRACDHYNKYNEDFDLAKKLNHNAHRFSLEWSRLEPAEGRFDQKAITHYRKVILALKERGLEPFVTLWHYTLPLWFFKRGGWLHPRAQQSYLKFVNKMVSAYKDVVRYWLTMNEPETIVRQGYLQAIRPPEQRSLSKAFKVLNKLTNIHNQTYGLIHRLAGKQARVGFVESLVYFESYNNWPHNLALTSFLNWYRNKLFVPKVVKHCDFIGLNYYFHSRIRFNPVLSQFGFQFNENKRGLSDLGWEIYPQGIYQVLMSLKKYSKPVYLTEVGIADAQDSKRAKYIKDYLSAAHQAIRRGVDVRGSFYWSLLDNFEWSDGFWPRFGLIEVDYKTLVRTVRPSAWLYAKICQENQLAP